MSALALAASLILGSISPLIAAGTAAAATIPEIGAVATAFRLSGDAGANNIKVDWPIVGSASAYEILRSDSESGSYLSIAKTSANTYDDYGLATGKTYFYQVHALDPAGALIAQSAAAKASTAASAGPYNTYDNTQPSSLKVKSNLEAGGVYYRYDYQSDANGFTQLVEKTSADGYTFTGDRVVLSRNSDPSLASCKLESLSITKNPSTGKFVLWAHYENKSDYTLAQVAVADAVPGQSFHFDGTYRPLGHESRDLTFFADSDGTGYLVSAANNNSDLNLYKLSTDWQSITEQDATLFAGQSREAPSMVHAAGFYYLFTSEAAGWYPSQGKYASSTSPSGPWTELRDIGNTSTFGAQSGGIVRMGDQYAMMANRWGAQWKYPEAANSGRMLPLSFNKGYAAYDYFQNVDYNSDAGTIVPVQTGKIISTGKPVRSSGLSADAAGEDVLYGASKANDGVQSSKDNYYKSDKVPFSWEVDLQNASLLNQVNLTTKLVKGSETYYSYKIEGSLDRKNYTLLVDETGNQIVGFKSHGISNTDKFRYVRITVTKVTNINNGNTADWARGINEFTVFGTPTSDPAPDTVDTPSVNIAAGTYYSPQSVTLTDSTDGADIYYSTDGSTPSKTNGSKYTSPLHIGADATLKAVAVKDGMIDSAVLSQAYSIKAGATPVSLIQPVGVATYTGEMPALPGQVNVKTADGATRPANVTWDLEGYSFNAPYRTFNVTGSVEGALTISAQVEVVPKGTVYFVDSGMHSTTPSYASVKQLAGSGLLNNVADQQYTPDGWGYVNDNGSYVGQRDGTVSDKDETGLYAKGNSGTSKPIIYNIPLTAGTYTLTAGFREWWSGPRQMKVSVVSSTGVTTVITPNVTVSQAAADKTKMVSNQFTLAGDGLTQVKVELAGGSEAPVIGWFGIASGSVSVDTTPIIVDPPTASVPGGIYKTAQTVALSTTTAGASIYYTTDGSDASRANGTKYAAPIIVDKSETLKAVAVSNGTESTALEAAYDMEPVPDTYTSVPVGKTWYDTTGNPIQAHGGNILHKDGWYYWVGENKTANSTLFAGISLYKSQDLKNWTYVKDILTPRSSTAVANCNVERPKLVYNAQTDTFVLWAHWETATSYSASHLLVATSKTVDGDYQYQKDFRPGAGQVTTPDADPTYSGGDSKWGYGSRDFTVFQDPDSTDAYLVSAQDSSSMRVYKLTADYTDVDWAHSYSLFVDQRREAPALIKSGDYYFVFTSSQSGWYANQAMYSYTKNIADPNSWSALKPVGNNTTFFSQPTNIVPIQGTDGTRQYVYMGDRWNSKALGASTYVWLPLKFDAPTGAMDPSVTMRYEPGWSFDAGSGAVTLSSDRLVSQGKPVEAVASNSAYPASAANDGNYFNLNVSGDNSNYYSPPGVPFTWTVDLQQRYDLSRIDLSFRSYNGSETYSGYVVDGSNDDATWTRLASETANKTVGFKSNGLEGKYRYVRVSVSKVVNDHNGGAASWAAGLVEAQVFSHPDHQSVDFGPLVGKTFGDADFGVSAAASSGLPVSFTAAGQCTVDGSSVHLTGAGECTLTAGQAGDANFYPAGPVVQKFSIAKAPQSIRFGTLADQVVGAADVNIQAVASSGLPVQFSTRGACQITGSSVHLTEPGTCTVTASQTGNGNYLAAEDVTQAFSVTYRVLVVTDLSKAVRAGATLALRLNLTDAAGSNLSSSTVTVHAIGIDGTQGAPSPGDSQRGQDFRLDPLLRTYGYNIKTSGLPQGQHTLSFTAGADPTVHQVTFTVTK